MMRADVPLNLAATSRSHAYMITGDAKYRQSDRAVVEAWMKRVEENGGVIPDTQDSR